MRKIFFGKSLPVVVLAGMMGASLANAADCMNGRITWYTGESHQISLYLIQMANEVYSARMISDAADAPIPDFVGAFGKRIAFKLDTKCRTIYSGEFVSELQQFVGEAWCTTDVGPGAKATWTLGWGNCRAVPAGNSGGSPSQLGL